MKQLPVLAFFIALASCSGRSGGVLPNGAISPANDSRSGLPRPPVITPSFARSAPSIAAPNVPLVSAARIFATAKERPMSSVGPGDREEVGIEISAGGPYTGIYAAQTAYTGSALKLTYPKGGSGTSDLLTLAIPPNRSCLSSGEVYSNSGAGTTASFAAIDQCTAGKILYSTPIDASFQQNYVRTDSYGHPALVTIVYTWDKVPTVNSTWYAFIYSFAAQQWQRVASKKGLRGSGLGYSSWKSEFVAGLCPSTAQIATDSLQLFNGTTHAYETVKPAMTQTMTSPYQSAASCFQQDASGPATFAFGVSNFNAAWVVQSGLAEFPISSTATGIAAGHDGNLWFTEPKMSKVGRITPTGTVTEFQTLTANSSPSAITENSDGNAWFVEYANSDNINYKIGRITPTGTITEFTVYDLNGAGIVATPNSDLWVANYYPCLQTNSCNGTITRMTTTGSLSYFASGGPHSAANDFAVAPDGTLYYSFSGVDHNSGAGIGKITPDGTNTTVTNAASPSAMIVGPDGDLWIVVTGGVERMTSSGTVLASYAGVGGDLAIGPDGNIWFSAGTIGRITPSGMITEYPFLGLSGPTGAITSGPDGNLWFTESDNRLGRIAP